MFENLINTLELWGDIIASEYKTKLTNEGITATGKLFDSVIRLPVSIDGYTYEVSLQLEDYWKQVEYGRGKTVNGGTGEVRKNILNWISKKPVLPRPMENGKLPTVEQLAYLISRKIHREGYIGKRPLGRTLDELREDIKNDISKALTKDLSIEVMEILKEIDSK